MLIVAALLSVVMGVVLGALGGGGSVLTVPILVYALNQDPKVAIATSLLVVAITSTVSAVQHARAGNVRWRIGLIFGAVAMVGSYFGGLAAGFVSGTLLLILFATMMVATGAAMLRKRKAAAVETTPTKTDLPMFKVIAEGLAVGGFTGLVGAGGGFLVVPVLNLMGGLSMRSAIGTSLLVISMKSFAGFAGHIQHVSIDTTLAVVVTTAAIVGSFVGVGLTKRISPATLRRGFGFFVLAMAAFILYKEVGPALGL